MQKDMRRIEVALRGAAIQTDVLNGERFARPDVRLRQGRPVSQYAGLRGLHRDGRCGASCIGDGP